MVFLHFAQIPEAGVMGSLHVLQVATVVGKAGSEPRVGLPWSRRGEE